MAGKHNESKSNRSASDLFELLIIKYICDEYGLEFSYNKDLSEVMDKLLTLDNADERISLQKQNLTRLKPYIKQLIDSEITKKGDLVRVEWIGRNLKELTTSDVDIHHKNGMTRISLKSISGDGLGTAKNIGMNNFKDFYGFDPNPYNDEMWEKLIKYLISQGENCSHLGKTAIKELCQTKAQYLAWAKLNCRPYQELFNKLSCEGFNKLSNNDKKKVVNYISDSKDEELYVVIVNEVDKPIIYKPNNKYSCGDDNNIKGVLNTRTGFLIYVDNVPLYRVNTNCTNGLGISPFCQRVFIVK